MRVPPFRQQLTTKQMKRNLPRLSFATANLFRDLVLKAMGITREKEKEYRICNRRPIKQDEKDVLWRNTKDQIQKSKVTINLPLKIGRNCSLNSILMTERQIDKENWLNDVINKTQQQLVDSGSGLLFDVDQRKLLSQTLEFYKNSIEKESVEKQTAVSGRISVEKVIIKRAIKSTYITWNATDDKYIKMSTGIPSKA